MRKWGVSILVVLGIILTGCGSFKDAVRIDNSESMDRTTPMQSAKAAINSPIEALVTDEIGQAAQQNDDSNTIACETLYERTAKRDLLALMLAYPNHIADIESADGLLYIEMKSGSRIVYDDMQSKDFSEKLANADLQDMMELAYPMEDNKLLFEGDYDPGRIRSYEFLMAVYGDSQSAVEANLAPVKIDSKTYLFNGENAVAQKLASVFVDIEGLISEERDIAQFVYPLASAYYYRAIAGTNRLSMHSFGIAIDLRNVKTDYWRYATREQGQERLDVFPTQVVSVFEENGFIWGGKWAHFDLLHFEYRPELILKAKYEAAPKDGAPWYLNYPDTGETAACIETIDKAFRGN